MIWSFFCLHLTCTCYLTADVCHKWGRCKKSRLCLGQSLVSHHVWTLYYHQPLQAGRQNKVYMYMYTPWSQFLTGKLWVHNYSLISVFNHRVSTDTCMISSRACVVAVGGWQWCLKSWSLMDTSTSRPGGRISSTLSSGYSATWSCPSNKWRYALYV